ncbi:MAG: hypothetical protein J0L75_11785 [Spirochaetes bacterium]|nr:hypothetical protein [Spirochaetota bacterium]
MAKNRPILLGRHSQFAWLGTLFLSIQAMGLRHASSFGLWEFAWAIIAVACIVFIWMFTNGYAILNIEPRGFEKTFTDLMEHPQSSIDPETHLNRGLLGDVSLKYRSHPMTNSF